MWRISRTYQCDAKACFRNMVESLEVKMKELGFIAILREHCIYYSNPMRDQISIVLWEDQYREIDLNAIICSKAGEQFLDLVVKFYH